MQSRRGRSQAMATTTGNPHGTLKDHECRELRSSSDDDTSSSDSAVGDAIQCRHVSHMLSLKARKRCEMMRDSHDSPGSFNSCSAVLDQSQCPTSTSQDTRQCIFRDQRELVSFDPNPTLYRSATCVDIRGMNVAAGTTSSHMPCAGSGT